MGYRGRATQAAYGRAHQTLGQAALTAGDSGELIVSNIGPGGQEGVAIDLVPLPESLQWEPVKGYHVTPNPHIEPPGMTPSFFRLKL